VGATSRPFSQYRRKTGETLGDHWRIPSVKQTRQVRHVLADTNFWKSFLHARLGVGLGGVGCLSLFGNDPTKHRMISEHIVPEYGTAVTARDQTVYEWKLRPSRPDNHFLDCLVQCAVAGSMLGCRLLDALRRRGRRRRRVDCL
jgi:hypothetical protein